MQPPTTFTSTVLGYPRIGPRRELKTAVESYWAGDLSAAGLQEAAAQLRAQTRDEIAAAGIDAVPGNTFSFYDHMLDTAVMLGVVPPRFQGHNWSPLDTYFAMARGRNDVAPLEMTKWFDTNYHYLVPEIGPATAFALDPTAVLADIKEADEQGIPVRPVVVGPITFALLSKAAADAPDDFVPYDRLDEIVSLYADLLSQLHAAGVAWVQFDEPALVADRTDAEIADVDRVYRELAAISPRPQILVATYFGDPGPALDALADTGIDGIALDLVSAPDLARRIPQITALRNLLVVAGLVAGRNVWRTDLSQATATLPSIIGASRHVAVSTSCSLLHVPYDLDAEPDLEPEVRDRLASARQKCAEVALLARALGQRGDADAAEATREIAAASDALHVARDKVLVNKEVQTRLEAVGTGDRERAAYAERLVAQQDRLGLPALPTTTIGSFPQTKEVRRARADWRAGRLDEAAYVERMRAEIDRVIEVQEEIGLDVLVHGEPERNDMVQYFGEQLDGFAFTKHGWVQSYGTRCVRPPILHGDVSRPAPMTTAWTKYAQSRTERPVKGMLTGPVTILAWSFVRDDQPLAQTADQVALALRDEVADLESAGVPIIQVDEPALRELLPLRQADRADYLAWAVGAFRLATSVAAPSTQIHTHLCYSEFGDVIEAIDALDADVTTIEAARSRMEVLDDLARIGYARGVGPGVYDIHSPRVPSATELDDLIAAATQAVPPGRLWVNPDCGLKTRDYPEVSAALQRMVCAATSARSA